ncbi:hypothetical protein [Escherichia coli]|nr:hypothetical protein [Escherichia coli]
MSKNNKSKNNDSRKYNAKTEVKLVYFK